MKTEGKEHVSYSLAQRNCRHLRNYINSLRFLMISYTKVKTSSVFDTRMKQKVIIWSSTWRPRVWRFRETIVFAVPNEHKNRQPRVLYDGL